MLQMVCCWKLYTILARIKFFAQVPSAQAYAMGLLFNLNEIRLWKVKKSLFIKFIIFRTACRTQNIWALNHKLKMLGSRKHAYIDMPEKVVP